MARNNGGGNGGGGGGGGGNGGGVVLKKGPWTKAEDSVLLEYVRRHGEGNWNSVRRETGLQRCGKSCRLRWANHLRPNLRKGPLSADEKRHISLLHGLIGNKWARISSHLPGRTDNEIKNYWNTRLKRRHRQNRPLYPPEVEQEIALLRAQNNAVAAVFHANATLPPPQPQQLLYDAGGNNNSNPFALQQQQPPMTMASSPSPTHSPAPLINQNYSLLNQMQVFQSQQQQTPAAVFHQQQPDAAAAFGGHGHGGGGGIVVSSGGLPPLPTNNAAARAAQAQQQQQAELPSNQFDTTSSCREMLESLMIDDEHLLLRPNNPSMVKVPSMPALSSHREPLVPPPSPVSGSGMLLPAHSAGSDGDLTSYAYTHWTPAGDDDIHHNGAAWDFSTFGAEKPAKRRTASEVGMISDDTFATSAHQLQQPAGGDEWFVGTCGGGSTAAPSPVVTTDDDDELNLEAIQQFMSSMLPLSTDDGEHGGLNA